MASAYLEQQVAKNAGSETEVWQELENLYTRKYVLCLAAIVFALPSWLLTWLNCQTVAPAHGQALGDNQRPYVL
jgi:hypothetical protein